MATLSHTPPIHHRLSNHGSSSSCRGSYQVELWHLGAGKESAGSNAPLPGLRPCHRDPSLQCVLVQELRLCSPGFLESLLTYLWTNNTNDYRVICRVPHSLSSKKGHLWELVGTVLIIMPEQQAYTRTVPGKPNHTVTSKMMCNSKNFSQGSQAISLMLYSILLVCPIETECEPQT